MPEGALAGLGFCLTNGRVAGKPSLRHAVFSCCVLLPSSHVDSPWVWHMPTKIKATPRLSLDVLDGFVTKVPGPGGCWRAGRLLEGGSAGSVLCCYATAAELESRGTPFQYRQHSTR